MENMDPNQKRFLLIAGGVTAGLLLLLFLWQRAQGATTSSSQNTVTPAVVDQTQLDQAITQALQDSGYTPGMGPVLTVTNTPPPVAGPPVLPPDHVPVPPRPPVSQGPIPIDGPGTSAPPPPYQPAPAPAPPPAPAPVPRPAPPPAPAPAPAPQATHYVVKSGDTLWGIAQRFYGNGAKYWTIFNANRNILQNPDLIRPGEVLTIPSA